jgi:iron complex transport system permease protein
MRLARKYPFHFHFALLALSLAASIAFGAVDIPIGASLKLLASRLPAVPAVLDLPAYYEAILFDIRLPHTALVFLTGAALAGSGAAYQGLFRNPLADPYLIGVASGAGLGAVVVMAFLWPTETSDFFTIPAAAFIGGLATVTLVYVLAQTGRTTPVTSLILAGVAVSSFATALTSYLMLRSQGELRRVIAWLLGGSTLSGWQPVIAAAPYILVGLLALLALGHALNLLQFGEEQAQQLGLPVGRIKLLLILFASLAAAAAVAFSGIIGFVGMIVPHAIRYLWGPDYRRLIPLSILGGASVLLLADILARRLLAPEVLPIGVITALVGAPFFLWVLRRVKGQRFW